MSTRGDFRAESDSEVRVASPFPVAALPRLWSWIEDFRERVADDFSPQTLEEMITDWREREKTRKTWGVWRGEELGGLVSWEPWPVANVGVTHALFKRSFWGRRTTRTALMLVYQELFDSGIRKILGFPFKGNNAIIELGKSLGAKTEGVLREQTMRGGIPVDLVVLGLLKEDFEKCRNSFQLESRLSADSLPIEREPKPPPLNLPVIREANPPPLPPGAQSSPLSSPG
jgi:RimJ/RimL family protein N-acetyltransferase